MSDTTTASPRSRRLALIGGVLAFIVLIGLGTWQIQRLHWKEALLATIAERMAAPPLSVADIEQKVLANTLQDVDYYAVTATGLFRHESERHFFATWKGETGYYVYTPLQLVDGRFVFINRGFVPYELKDPAKRLQGQIAAGPVTINGLSRNVLTEKPSFVVPDNDPAKNIFHWKDIRAMTASAGLPADAVVLPFFIDADATPNPGGLPIGGVTMIDLPNNHLQYALTWYGLAAALVAVLGLWLRRTRKV
ncbi:MAG: SURF1 family protein [Rhizobiaceae bacterium]